MDTVISIIIPTYNRSQLLGSTLDSILKQDYNNWECIIVDDGSTDPIRELMEFYCIRDTRFRFFHRPKTRPKGANACRNYGFELSRGKYLQWFDSDDLMVKDFLSTKIRALEENDVDYVISKAANFLDPDPENIISWNEKYYRFEDFEITNYNYITQKINWLTYDFLGKREVVEKIRFNEKLKSSQEYNFFCKLTCFSVGALVLDEYLTLRRIHADSIRNTKRKEEQTFIKLETWREISSLKPGSEAEKFFLFSLLKLNSRERLEKGVLIYLLINCFKQNRLLLGISMVCYRHIYSFTGKGYFLRRILIRSLSKSKRQL